MSLIAALFNHGLVSEALIHDCISQHLSTATSAIHVTAAPAPALPDLDCLQTLLAAAWPKLSACSDSSRQRLEAHMQCLEQLAASTHASPQLRVQLAGLLSLRAAGGIAAVAATPCTATAPPAAANGAAVAKVTADLATQLTLNGTPSSAPATAQPLAPQAAWDDWDYYGPDGVVYGAYSLSQLEAWAGAGHLSPNVQVGTQACLHARPPEGCVGGAAWMGAADSLHEDGPTGC